MWKALFLIDVLCCFLSAVFVVPDWQAGSYLMVIVDVFLFGWFFSRTHGLGRAEKHVSQTA
jgi:hypothetical protein